MPTAAELLAALPADEPQAQPCHVEELEQIFHSLANRPVPTGALRRFCSLGGLSAKLSMAYLAYWIRGWYQPTEAREKDLLETHLRSAINTLETMGYLRGAVAKLGQLMTCFPDTLPKGFVDVLGHLHFQAPPMHYALIREQLLSELGDPEDIFAEFDETAIAAASIGQVHRAQLKTGEQVAVKIQYPGIARTIRSDLRNLKITMRPFLLNRDWQAIEQLFDEIRTGLEFETDYEHEAQNLHDCGRLFADDEDIVVPHVFESFSTRRVLTMNFIEGQTFDEFLAANPSQPERDHYGKLILKAMIRTYTNRMLYSDAHPGNFLFMEDGRMGFVDFGNVRRFNDVEWQYYLDGTKAREGNEEDQIVFCKRSLMMTDEDAMKYSEMLDLVVEWFGLYNEPLLYEGAFDYGDPEYLRRMAELLARATKQRWVKQEPMNLFSHRLNFQLPALLFQIKSRVDVAQLVREESES